MSNRLSLDRYFAALRRTEPIDFDRSRKVVEAATIVSSRRIASLSMRVGMSLFWRRYSDAFLFPLLSAGLSVLVLVCSSQTLAIDEGHHRIAASDAPASSNMMMAQHTPSARRIQHASERAGATNESNQSAIIDPIPDLHSIASRETRSEIPSRYYGQLPAGSPILTSYEGSLDVGVRSIGATIFGSASAAQTRSPLQNGALSLSYRLGPTQAIGVEAGEECLGRDVARTLTVLTGDPVTGHIIRQEKRSIAQANDLVAWYGAFYRYTATDLKLASNVAPYGELLAGYTSIGPMGKAIAGIQYSPVSLCDVQLGTEFTYLNYNFDGTRRSSCKLAMTLGIVGKW